MRESIAFDEKTLQCYLAKIAEEIPAGNVAGENALYAPMSNNEIVDLDVENTIPYNEAFLKVEIQRLKASIQEQRQTLNELMKTDGSGN